MVSSATSRSTFITSCVKFLLKYGFDGLDLDWEYPAMRGGQPKDKENFALLLQEMKASFKQHKLLLTSAVSAGKATIDLSYNITALAR
ncbi:Acidic mammalian chitinase [Portunus trituberculatus]|uniref:Acidic mammalian chitinase n=1 Tax=Portunus trituberculatus TaxID=210409 RepID=A0A5B7ILC1_PORTR|nr:Acidic mammalian chitinase [Portunus trituberculatus]